jgi:uncharacterized protein YqcC (DUF446 family)
LPETGDGYTVAYSLTVEDTFGMQKPLSPQRVAIASALIDVEAELRSLGLWQQERPSESALASLQPFAIDTLQLEQWLQFIYLPTFHALLAQDMDLPAACGVAPMVEEAMRGRGLMTGRLEAALTEVDRLINPS